ncbi:unnamed protein product [Closterium sp. Naga37s-1]|nr:unnamed protein product [Closterium sp. Naga37s-1]
MNARTLDSNYLNKVCVLTAQPCQGPELVLTVQFATLQCDAIAFHRHHTDLRVMLQFLSPSPVLRIALPLPFSPSQSLYTFNTAVVTPIYYFMFTTLTFVGCLKSLPLISLPSPPPRRPYQSLDTFNTAVVTPIYYVMFTTLTIVASVIMYKAWAGQTGEQVLMELCGFLTILIGTYLLHATKDFAGDSSRLHLFDPSAHTCTSFPPLPCSLSSPSLPYALASSPSASAPTCCTPPRTLLGTPPACISLTPPLHVTGFDHKAANASVSAGLNPCAAPCTSLDLTTRSVSLPTAWALLL